MHQPDVPGVVQALALSQQAFTGEQFFDFLMAILGELFDKGYVSMVDRGASIGVRKAQVV